MAGPGAATDRAMAPRHHAVFIDTSLDTHLAMIVSDSDTVSDLKVKITLEHPVCFPQAGKIKVDAIKVKRRGHSYHLCDSMLVTNALGGLKKNWFLFVDISKQIEHPESGVLGTLLALTDKPSTDIVADNEQKKSSDLVISATLQSPIKACRGLEPMIARNHEIQPEIKTSQHASATSTLGVYSESMNATSAILSVGKTDDLGDTNLNAKKRRKRNQASSSMDEPPQKNQILGDMHEESVRVNNEENRREPDKVAEPQIFVGVLSPMDHDTSVAENPDNLLKQADVEMDDVDASKEKNQTAAEFDDVNGIVSMIVSEANNSQGKGNSISAVHNSADINHHISEVSDSHRNDGLEAPNDLLAEQHINVSQDKMESGNGEVKDAGKSLDAEKIMEEKFSPKKRKKSRKPKSTSENPIISLGGHSPVESPEIPLGDHSLVETLKPTHGDASDKPENKEHNISPPQVKGIEVAVEEANVTSHEKQGNEMESSQQITEKAGATADDLEEKKKKKRKKSSKLKSSSENPKIPLGGHSLVESLEISLGEHSLVEPLKPPHDDASDKPENKEHNVSPPQVEGIEVAVEEANVTSEKQVNEMESSQQIIEKAAATADDVEEKKKKKRKKSSKPKSTSENPNIPLGSHSLVENPEVPLGEYSLVETLKPPHGDASDKPENKEHNISPTQVEDIGVVVEEANVTSHEKQGDEMESSKQVTEKAAATADNVEEKKKNINRKKRGTEEKNVQESRDRTDDGENNVPNANEKEREVTAAINNPDEYRSEAMPLELKEGAVNADNGEKEKPKRRTKKRKEKNIQQAEGGPEKGEIKSSQVEGNEMVINAFEKKSNEENVDESKVQHREAVDDVKDKAADKRGRKRRSDKNVCQLTGDKDDISHSQTEGKEPLEIAGVADDKSPQEQVNQIEPVHEAAELKAAPDKVEHAEKKSRKRQSNKEKSSGQSTHVSEKEEVNPSHVEVEERATMDDGKVSLLEQQVSEKPSNAGNHEEKVEKKSRQKRSSKEKNLASKETVGLNSKYNENETMSMEKKVEDNVEKMEKPRKRKSKEKNVSSQEVNGTRDSSHKENLPTEEGTGLPVEEKIEKKSRIRKSSKVKNVPVQELKESSHNEILQRENVARADETSDHMVEVPGTDKINIGDYFLPGQARPNVAASVTDSVDEGKNKKSQVDKFRSSVDPDKLASHPDKDLSEVTGNGSEAAAVTAFGRVKSYKVAGRSAALGNNGEVSASSTSSLNRPVNTRKAGKSRSSRDQFRVAIRKLSNNNNTIVGSESKRSLLAVPGAIFKEDSSGSSKHEAESDHSFSSMRTPSKKLFDYSSSGSDANEDTTDDENLSGEIGRMSNGKSGYSGDKSMTLNNILRSSSRYKKAKQAAVESQLNDSESQPVDFVPDSQANN